MQCCFLEHDTLETVGLARCISSHIPLQACACAMKHITHEHLPGSQSVQQNQNQRVTYTKHKGHQSTEDCEQDVSAFIAEAATSLKKDEGRNKERSNGVQQCPMHRRQKPACCGLSFTLCMRQPLRCLQDLADVGACPSVISSFGPD